MLFLGVYVENTDCIGYNGDKRKARLNIRRASFCDDITTPIQSLPMVWVTYRSKRDLHLAPRPEYGV